MKKIHEFYWYNIETKINKQINVSHEKALPFSRMPTNKYMEAIVELKIINGWKN